jgi:hypothetical protein
MVRIFAIYKEIIKFEIVSSQQKMNALTLIVVTQQIMHLDKNDLFQ